MKKIILFILMFATIFTLGACKKKEPTPRVMDNFLNDFEIDNSKYDAFERITRKEKVGNNYSSIDGSIQNIHIFPKYKAIIKSVSFTIYNHSETDYSFYLCDPSYFAFNKSKSEGRTYYQIGVSEMVKGVELRPNEEYTITFDVNEKVSKNSAITIYYQPYTNYAEDPDGFKKIKENGGIYNFKIDYEVYL